MERLYVYDGALAVIGLSVVVQTVVTGSDLLTGFVAVSGGAMVAGAGYDAIRRDPAEFSVPAGAVFGLVLAAVVSLLGALLSLGLAT